MNLKEILASYKNIAVVGLSNKPTKPSYVVAEYLKKKGYRIIPINPTVNEVLGEKCYKDLKSLPENLKKSLEIVNIFRPAEEAKLIVEEVVQLKKEYGKPYVVWMQLGIVNEEAAEKAKKAGIIVVMDKCIMTEHKRIYS
jgi:hypothetical protein